MNADMHRRTFLKLGSLSTLGWMAANALAWSEPGKSKDSDKSLIVLWMDGGPSQLETFDPHPGTEIGGPTRAIPTATPGVTFAHHLPQLAELSPHVAVLRSVISKEGDHDRGAYHLRTGYRPDPTVNHPTLGAICAHELTNDRLDLPPYVSILSGNRYAEGGYLGSSCQAYKIGDPLYPPRNLRSTVSDESLQRRLAGLELLERKYQKRDVIHEAVRRQEQQTEQALRLMRSEQQRAFQVEDEPASVRVSYGNTPFGRGCLAARRLVETGVRAVEVQLGGWDSHATNFDAHEARCRDLDAAFASLIRDLRDRDLLDRTLVVWGGEFGRTPIINGLDGRDHWPHGFSVVLAGGGATPGIYGATDPKGSKNPVDPITVPDLSASILQLLGVNPQREFTSSTGRPIKLSDGVPMAKLCTS